jgi:sugar lactone lactonase YvrE
MIGCKIYTVIISGKVNPIIEVENQPNGMCFTDNGTTLIYSSMFDAKLHRYDMKTRRSELYADLSELMTGYCGDMVIDTYGRIFIDDTGARVLHGEQPKPGRILMLDPASKNVISASENLIFPNGIAIDSTGTKLFVSESFAYRLERFSIDADGQLSNRTTIWDTHDLAPLVNKEFGRFSVIDGIAIDAKDGIWMSMLGFEMFIRRDRDGNITHQILVDGDATACALGGEAGKTLYLVVNKVPDGEALFEAMVAKRTRCSIYTVEVDVPRGTTARP